MVKNHVLLIIIMDGKTRGVSNYYSMLFAIDIIKLNKYGFANDKVLVGREYPHTFIQQ
ncbi:hypothetical protein TXYLGN1_27860 [Tepidimicrobium xylanilyticum]|nr:hypothetical protein EN5CB1_23010 [Tepidimicrobium xylanilyticum]